MNMDYESWRCTHSINLMCPEEGCTQREGCARDRGWDGIQPGPRNDEDRRVAVTT